MPLCPLAGRARGGAAAPAKGPKTKAPGRFWGPAAHTGRAARAACAAARARPWRRQKGPKKLYENWKRNSRGPPAVFLRFARPAACACPGVRRPAQGLCLPGFPAQNGVGRQGRFARHAHGHFGVRRGLNGRALAVLQPGRRKANHIALRGKGLQRLPGAKLAALLAGQHAALPALHHGGHLVGLFIPAKHHVLRGGAALQKAGGIGAVRGFFQLAQHLGRANVLLRVAQAHVQRPAVGRGGAGRIVKGFGAALYFQAGDARLHQLAQQGRGAQIVCVQNIAAALVFGHVKAARGKFGAAGGQLLRAGGVHRLPLPAAGLRAGAAVCVARRKIVR